MIKKSISILLVLIMVLASSVFVFAEDSFDSEITIGEEQISAPVEFVMVDNKLVINEISVLPSTILEIAKKNGEILFCGTVSELPMLSLEDGEYLVLLTENVISTINYYYGTMLVEYGYITAIGFDSHTYAVAIDGQILPQALGTQYEAEPDNSITTAMELYNDYDLIGRIYDDTDEDWYKVKFSTAGSANFWLGNIPTGADFDLYLYNSSGSLITSSTGTTSQELITRDVVANAWYYLRVVGKDGSWSVSNYTLRAKVYFDYGDLGWKYMYKQNGTMTASYTGEYRKISSEYGPRDYTTGRHCGFDIVSINGAGLIARAPIYNVEAGSCANSGWSDGEGYFVRVRTTIKDPGTNNYLVVNYKHLDEKPTIKVNDSVNLGALIGYTGMTGEGVTGYHLHFQVNRSGTATDTYEATIDPMLFYPNVSFLKADGTPYNTTNIISDGLNVVSNEESEESSVFEIIPSFVIDYVGKDAFETWLNNTDEHNIFSAISYFAIEKDELESIIPNGYLYDINDLYNSDCSIKSRTEIMNRLDKPEHVVDRENSI